MKVKTSVTLSEELLEVIDSLGEEYKNRSEFLETAAWAFVREMERAVREAHDMDIIERNAKRLNEEAFDVLEYQVLP